MGVKIQEQELKQLEHEVDIYKKEGLVKILGSKPIVIRAESNIVEGRGVSRPLNKLECTYIADEAVEKVGKLMSDIHEIVTFK